MGSHQEALETSEEYQVLAEVGRVVAASTDLKEVFDPFAKSVGRLLPFDTMSISFPTTTPAQMRVVHLSGLSVSEWLDMTMQDMPGMIEEKVFVTAKPQLLSTSDMEEVARLFPAELVNFQAGTRSLLAVPLIAENRVQAVLAVSSKLENAYSSRESATLQRIAQQIAGAVHTSKLYQELKSSELKLRVLNTELDRRVQERTAELESFAYSVSHDLRAPVRHIRQYSRDLLEEHGSDMAGGARDYLSRILSATERMTQLIDDLLALARVARIELTLDAVDLSQLVREHMEGLLATQSNRHIKVQVEDGVRAHGDKRLLSLAIENLLSNALKFSGKHPNPTIEFGAQTVHGELRYFIRDNGVGFDMNAARNLFSPFQRLHSQSDYPGTGIGLAIVRRVMARHDGRIWAESRPGEGATFYFVLGSGARQEIHLLEDLPSGVRGA
ncbi:MAG: GAF domain-containing protein [SAR202 cluster bacterium]|nr:GAF domain-containing protein [SAR202 cluster bacterium]